VDGDDVVITVTDDGIGFADADRHRIFDMFVQLDESRSQSTGGLGIGLTLVRSIVAMHGGRIDAQSEGPGRGATFTLHLPKASTVTAAESAGSVPLLPANRGRVLVVDDNVDAAESLAAMLRLQGFDVRAAYGGAQALEMARGFRPEVAFIDLTMPGMSGIELAAALRAEASIEELRLVALTGMGQKSDGRNATCGLRSAPYEAGATGGGRSTGGGETGQCRPHSRRATSDVRNSRLLPLPLVPLRGPSSGDSIGRDAPLVASSRSSQSPSHRVLEGAAR